MALPLALLLAVFVPWAQRIDTLDTQMQRDVERLQRYRQLRASLPALRTELAREQERDEYRAFYFIDKTPVLAGARIQGVLQNMVQEIGARSVSTQMLTVDERERPPRVIIRSQLQGSSEQLLELLLEIENARPFLFVDQMSIRTTARSNAGTRGRPSRGRNAADSNMDNLVVRLDVFGYVLGADE